MYADMVYYVCLRERSFVRSFVRRSVRPTLYCYCCCYCSGMIVTVGSSDKLAIASLCAHTCRYIQLTILYTIIRVILFMHGVVVVVPG